MRTTKNKIIRTTNDLKPTELRDRDRLYFSKLKKYKRVSWYAHRHFGY